MLEQMWDGKENWAGNEMDTNDESQKEEMGGGRSERTVTFGT